MKLVIFGCGKIAKRIVKGANLVEEISLVGFGSSDINKAKEYAQEYNCPLYGNYDYFLNSDVDAIYIATYNLNHYELIKKCLIAHKNVICEKPMLSSIKEVEELFALAKQNNVLLMEAMKAVFLPINIKVKQYLKNGLIGEVQYIEASFARNSSFDQNHWINDLKTGGALKDVGSYCAGILNYLMNKEPKVLYRYTNSTNISDTYGEVIVDYDGIKGHIVVSNSTNLENYLTISGDKGYIKVFEFWKSGKGYYVVDNKRYDINEEMLNDFYYEIKHFANLVHHKQLESPIMSKKASIDILKITSGY